MAGTRCAATASCSRRRRVSRRSRRLGGCRAGSRRRTCGAAAPFEVGRVPARTLELKARGAELFAELGRATSRAFGQGGVGDFLQNILGMSAGLTLVGVNGHEEGSFQVENSEPSIIGGAALQAPGRPTPCPTPPLPIYGVRRADCEWPDGPRSPSACPQNWPKPRPAGPGTPHLRG